MMSAVQTRTDGDIIAPLTPGGGGVSGKFSY